MKTRCNSRFVKKTYAKAHSWRLTARELNERFGVSLSHTAWRDYAEGRRDITDESVRNSLGLDPRACPMCGRKSDLMQLSRLLKRMTATDLEKWNQLRVARKYKTARRFLEEIYQRKTYNERRR